MLAVPLSAGAAVDAALEQRISSGIALLQPRMIEWRRDLHRNPELSNREVRTAARVAAHLKALGLPVETGIAKTGVVALLKGGKPGPTIALRADMDALPVTEDVDLPFRSRVTTSFRGETTGVMHACGHDGHTAILMGVAEVLVRVRAELPGSVLFIFQPAEEGAPDGEEGGAPLMLKEGLFERYKPEAAFALHAEPALRTGEIGIRSGALRAGSDAYRILVKGVQTHGARPWNGVDPIVTAAQIVTSLQTIVSRQVDITANPAVVTVGAIKGGIRSNIIPDTVEMIGTIRSFDPAQRAQILVGVTRIVENVAAANGATATFTLATDGNPVTFNDPALMARMLPALRRALGDERVKQIPLLTGAEDFAFFAQRVPSLYFMLGVTPAERSTLTAAATHSPRFYLDEASLSVGAHALTALVVDYLSTPR